MSYYLTALFTLILIISIVVQFPNSRIRAMLKTLDYVRLLFPQSTLFAPDPPILDFEILYRDRLTDDRLTVWRAIHAERTPLWGIVFWSPTKRWRKQLAFLCERLINQIHYELKSKNPGNRIYLSFAYVMLAAYVVRQAHGSMSDYTQFMVVLTFGFDEQKSPAILFISPFIRL